MKDLKARIISNKNIGTTYYKMELEASYIAKHAKPGQFVMVRIKDSSEPLLRRPLGVHRVKKDGKGFEMLYEVVGKGTEMLSARMTGEALDILGPIGNGFTLPKKGQVAVLVAGGVGVAPLISLAEGLKNTDIKTVVLLGAKTKKLILCEKDFKGLGAEVHIATDDGSKGYKGFVHQLFRKVLEKKIDSQNIIVYACGPDPMMRSTADICIEKEIPCEVLLEEKMACGIGACLGCAVEVKKKGYKLVCKDGPVFDASEIIWGK